LFFQNQSIVRHHETLITHTIKNACRSICPAEKIMHMKRRKKNRQDFSISPMNLISE
jgi:hypothetical protein